MPWFLFKEYHKIPWNGSGLFTRNYSWVTDASNGINITASRVDADTNDITGNGLDNCITRDGQGVPSANLPMANFKHTGVAGATATAQYAVWGSNLGIPAASGYLAMSNGTTAYSSLFIPRAFIFGMVLANDGVSPLNVMDVSAGSCLDSTNTVPIQLAAFTKSTAGAWSVGAGATGMGSGLTVGNNTWYHIFAIINNGLADVYFDTSVSAANKPTNTTAFRRIGSARTDGSANFLTFTQTGSIFEWITPVLEFSATSSGASAVTRTLARVPTGVVVTALLNVSVQSTGGEAYYLSPLYSTDLAPSLTIAPAASFSLPASSSGAGQMQIVTNTSAQIRSRQVNGAAADVLTVVTRGWVDNRGQFA